MSGPHPDPLDPIQNLEPAAQAGASHLGGSAVAASLSITAQVSIAISLKRIADAMEVPRIPDVIDLSKMSEADQEAFRDMVQQIKRKPR
jgi:hypothetical protein